VVFVANCTQYSILHMMPIWTYFVKLLSPIIVFTLSILLLNLVTTN